MNRVSLQGLSTRRSPQTGLAIKSTSEFHYVQELRPKKKKKRKINCHWRSLNPMLIALGKNMSICRCCLYSFVKQRRKIAY